MGSKAGQQGGLLSGSQTVHVIKVRAHFAPGWVTWLRTRVERFVTGWDMPRLPGHLTVLT